MVTETVCDLIGSAYKVDLSSPDVVIMIQVIKVGIGRFYKPLGRLWDQHLEELLPISQI